VCNEVLVEQIEIPALGHLPIIDAYLAPTCSHEGHTAGSHCARCGEVYVAAPDHNCSANSHHLTMHGTIPVREVEFPGAVRAWAVGGTPADCVHLAVSALLPQPVDLVVAGINRGSNLATDCLYSGTVAAALDG
jgi:5'-nucleotidase